MYQVKLVISEETEVLLKQQEERWSVTDFYANNNLQIEPRVNMGVIYYVEYKVYIMLCIKKAA